MGFFKLFLTCFAHVHVYIHKHRGKSESWPNSSLWSALHFCAVRPEVSALKPQETSSVNVGISNPTAPWALKVRNGALLPHVRPGLLRTAQEFLPSFGELFTVLEQKGESVTPPVECRHVGSTAPCRTRTLCPKLDFRSSFLHERSELVFLSCPQLRCGVKSF